MEKQSSFANKYLREQRAAPFSELSKLAAEQLQIHLRDWQQRGETELVRLSEVTEQYLVLQLAYTFSHFGIDTFAPSAQALLAVQMAKECALPFAFLAPWLETVSCILLEHQVFLSSNSLIPSWEELDASFLKTFCVRIMCADKHEEQQVGLDVWDKDLRKFLKEVSEKCIASGYSVHSNDSSSAELRKLLRSVPGLEIFEEPMRQILSETVHDPFVLLLRRIEIFVEPLRKVLELQSQSLGSCETPLFSRLHACGGSSSLNRIAGVLCLLQPHILESGEALFRNTPVGVEQMEALLWSQPSELRLSGARKDVAVKIAGITTASGHGSRFDLSLFKQWLGIVQQEGQENKAQARQRRKAELQLLLEQAEQLGLIYATRQPSRTAALHTLKQQEEKSNSKKKYGLTKTALIILRPYRDVVTGAITSLQPGMRQHSLELS